MLLCNSVFLFLLSVSSSLAQRPEAPVFDYVGINPDNGLVTVKWAKSPSADITGYVIQEELIEGPNSQSFPIVKVNITSPPYAHTFSYPKVLQKSVPFNVYAYTIRNHSVFESIRTTPSHKTVFVSAVYDSCKSSVILKWNPYVGWGSKLTGYYVQLFDENFNMKTSPLINAKDTLYTWPGIKENSNYCFYVSAIRNDGGASLSNKVCVATTFPLPPSLIEGNFTRYSGANKLDLQFSVDPAAVSDAYRLYRSDALTSNYTLIAELDKAADGSVNYTDNLPSSKVYNYKLVYLNKCKAEGVASVPINNIVLKAKSEAMTNSLNWNSFETWAQGTQETNVFRTTSGNSVSIASLSATDNDFADVISPQDQLSADICYQIKAVSNADANGKTYTSESNVFCVNMMGEIFIPNAFTPNSDGSNDIYKPSFAVLPSKYTFIIYNRYGSKVFETKNLSEGWNGILPDGKKALEGAYIFYIKLENGAGKVLEKRGNFNLIYP